MKNLSFQLIENQDHWLGYSKGILLNLKLYLKGNLLLLVQRLIEIFFRGFFKGDSVIGAALIKLSDFETKCTIYDTFPLVEGRKVVGGRIEAKVRIREPLLAKQIEEVKEKWLIFT